MIFRPIRLLGPGLLVLLAACSFEAPSVAPRPDGTVLRDLGPSDTSPSDGTTSDADTTDSGEFDAGRPDALEPDADPGDLSPIDAGQSPLASAGLDQRACATATVTVDGTGSSGDGLEYAWAQTRGPQIVLIDPRAPLTSFVAPASGTIELELTVDNTLGTDRDTTVIVVEATPSFELGPDRRVSANQVVAVTVSSSAAMHAGMSFAWTQLFGPLVALQGADTATVTFTAPAAGERVELALTLTSVCGTSSTDSISIVVNEPPNLVIGGPIKVLPHDTVLLDASASSDPENDALEFEWSFISGPAGHSGGFEPFPGTNNTVSQSATPLFYPTVPGIYFLNVSVSDGLDTDSVATLVEVGEIVALPYSDTVVAADSRAIAVRSQDGHVFVGTQSGAQEHRVVTNDVVQLGCIEADQVTVVRMAPDGRVYFGFANERRITELDSGGGCVSQTHDPGSVLNPNPASTRDILVVPTGDLYVATNAGTAFFERASTAFTQEIIYSALGGGGSDYAAVGLDGSGAYWFASRETNTARDGAVRVSDPLTAPTNSPRIDFLPGADDLHAFTTGLLASPAINEFWVLSRTRGLLRIQDADSPQTFSQYTIQNGGLPPALLQDELTRGVYDPETQDVWVAMRSGIARYKRDADAFVAIPLGVLGISGRVYDLAFDQDPVRGRTLYIATEAGALKTSSAP